MVERIDLPIDTHLPGDRRDRRSAFLHVADHRYLHRTEHLGALLCGFGGERPLGHRSVVSPTTGAEFLTEPAVICGRERMKPVLCLISCLLLLSVVAFSGRRPEDEKAAFDLRTWTSQAGSTISARLVSRIGHKVILETDQGRQRTCLRTGEVEPS